MNTMPWNYWSDDGTPRPEIVPVIAALETIIARNSRHPLALHLYIHAVEASSSPARAENEADTLANLVPGSGHLVHMPAHTYWRVGRYHDAAEANVRAAAVDEAYIAQCNAQGFYPAMYYPHNIHFLWSAASMEGRSAVAIEAARKVAANVRLEQIEQFPAVEFFKRSRSLRSCSSVAGTSFSRSRFRAPIWLLHRDLALRARRCPREHGRLERARTEAAALAPLKANDKILFLDGVDYPASALLAIADDSRSGKSQWRRTAAGRDCAFRARRRWAGCAAVHRAAVLVLPDAPVVWARVAARRRAADAEAVYRKDLAAYPHNGWSTFGLIQSLEAQGKSAKRASIAPTSMRCGRRPTWR